jgi:hypothetical protein
MNFIRLLVQSRSWVALGAAAWCVESFDRIDAWIRWTLVAHVFFLTWIAYLFLSDDAMRKHRRSVLIALTGACVTFQGFENIALPLCCGGMVLLYRLHWLPIAHAARFELRNIPLLNNLLIAACWVLLCMVWPMQQAGADLTQQTPAIFAAFLWVCALSMTEDMMVDTHADASLQLFGKRGLRFTALMLVASALLINGVYAESGISVWVSMALTLALILGLPGEKRSPLKSFLMDAVVVLRFPF